MRQLALAFDREEEQMPVSELRYWLAGCRPGCRHYIGEKVEEKVVDVSLWILSGVHMERRWPPWIKMRTVIPECAMNEACAERRAKILAKADATYEAALARGLSVEAALRAWRKAFVEWTDEPCPFWEAGR